MAKKKQLLTAVIFFIFLFSYNVSFSFKCQHSDLVSDFQSLHCQPTGLFTLILFSVRVEGKGGYVFMLITFCCLALKLIREHFVSSICFYMN